MHVILKSPITDLLILLLTLLLQFIQHSLQLGALQVHLVQTSLSILLLGLQAMEAAALPIQIYLHVLRVHQKTECTFKQHPY